MEVTQVRDSVFHILAPYCLFVQAVPASTNFLRSWTKFVKRAAVFSKRNNASGQFGMFLNDQRVTVSSPKLAILMPKKKRVQSLETCSVVQKR
jgi:hypothetical protein